MPKRMTKMKLRELQKMWQRKNMAEKGREALGKQKWLHCNTIHIKQGKVYADLPKTSKIISYWLETHAKLLLRFIQSLYFANSISLDFVQLSEQINSLNSSLCKNKQQDVWTYLQYSLYWPIKITITIQHAWFIKLFLCGQMCFKPSHNHSKVHISQPKLSQTV